MMFPKHFGRDADRIVDREADHFLKCPGCGEWFDMRDLGQVMAHVHGAEIEIGEGPEALRQFPVL